MKTMSLREVVKALTGPVTPVGETNEDERRFENLKALTELVDRLLGDVSRVRSYRYSPAFSESRAGKYAADFLKEVKEAD